MKKLLNFIFFVVLFVTILLGIINGQNTVYADEYDDLTQKINELQKALEMSKNATTPLETQVNSLKKQIEQIEERVNFIEQDIKNKRKIIDDGYKDLIKQKEIFNTTIKNHYIKGFTFSPLLVFISSANAQDAIRLLVYEKKNAEQDKAIITNIALKISDLETKQKELESEEKRLASAKTKFNSEKQDLEKIVKGAKEYQAKLSGEIADLSAKQQEILAARSGSFTVSIGDSELADDYNASIKGFRESAPSGSFAVFSFGAYTHRKGMSQYGARGRAQNGQNYRDILRAYYGKEPANKDTGGNISVSGIGDMDFEGRYLYGIAEMPSDWHEEALKAQAIAARTYAYRYKTNGQSICTNEACQVFSSSKADNPPERWKRAVEDTRGQVLEDVVTYYSSTTGGYISTMGWDTTDGNGGSDFLNKTYEKIGGSPWVYKAWYRKGYSNTGDSCGRGNPWMNETEIADIINAYFVMFGSGSGADTGRVTPITTSCWGGNPYSQDELRNISESYGGGISSVSGVSVLQGNGSTNEVVFQTNKGEKRLSAGNFKTAFNLRASGYMSIPQTGFSFFNIEKK